MAADEETVEQQQLLAEIGRLQERLRLAEHVCVMYAWSARITHTTDREKAAFELWKQWFAFVDDPEFVRPERHPDLSDEYVTELARKRDIDRQRTLDRIAELQAAEDG